MCFSTTASFVSGVLLTTIGVASIKKTQNHSQILFASIPFIFAIQQFSEGFVWLSLLNSTNHVWQQLATYCFLLFAIVIWPAWVPISMFFIEKNRKRKIILGVFFAMGLLFSLLSSVYLIFYNAEAQMTAYHIHYELEIHDYAKLLIGILYLIPTVMSNFISSVKGVFTMGIFVLVSYFISKLFFNDYVISVWCFFSALISITIYFILVKEARANKIEPIQVLRYI